MTKIYTQGDYISVAYQLPLLLQERSFLTCTSLFRVGEAILCNLWLKACWCRHEHQCILASKRQGLSYCCLCHNHMCIHGLCCMPATGLVLLLWTLLSSGANTELVFLSITKYIDIAQGIKLPPGVVIFRITSAVTAIARMNAGGWSCLGRHFAISFGIRSGKMWESMCVFDLWFYVNEPYP